VLFRSNAFRGTAANPGGGCAFILDNNQGGDSMKLIDATRSFGSVGILLPLILIFLISADAAYACPGTQTRVVYRT